MKITFKGTPKQVELVKAMASRDRTKAMQAQEAYAALMQPVVEKVIWELDTTNGLFTDLPFNENDDPSIPLDAFRDYKEDTLSVWSQEVAGGLASNYLTKATEEFKFRTYRVDSAINWDEKWARKSRLDYLAQYMVALAQELLRKRKVNAWTTLLTALANASHKVGTTATSHIFRATSAGVFDMDELNYWYELMDNLNQSVFGSEPEDSPFGLTDLYVSPNFISKIRSMTYNPINTKGANNITGTAETGVLGLSDAARAKLLNTAGAASFMGVTLHKMHDLGIGRDLALIFDAAAGATTYATRAGAGAAAFNGSTEQIAIGINGGQPFGFRPVETSDEEGRQTQFTLLPDDQFVRRSGKIGQYGFYNLGYLLTSTRPLSAFIL